MGRGGDSNGLGNGKMLRCSCSVSSRNDSRFYTEIQHSPGCISVSRLRSWTVFLVEQVHKYSF